MIFLACLSYNVKHHLFVRKDGKSPDGSVAVAGIHPVRQPVRSHKIHGFANVESIAEPSVIGPGKCNHELTRLLDDAIDRNSPFEEQLGRKHGGLLHETSGSMDLVFRFGVDRFLDHAIERICIPRAHAIPGLRGTHVMIIDAVHVVVFHVPGEGAEQHSHIQHRFGDPGDLLVQAVQQGISEPGQAVEVPWARCEGIFGTIAETGPFYVTGVLHLHPFVPFHGAPIFGFQVGGRCACTCSQLPGGDHPGRVFELRQRVHVLAALEPWRCYLSFGVDGGRWIVLDSIMAALARQARWLGPVGSLCTRPRRRASHVLLLGTVWDPGTLPMWVSASALPSHVASTSFVVHGLLPVFRPPSFASDVPFRPCRVPFPPSTSPSLLPVSSPPIFACVPFRTWTFLALPRAPS
eukprot:scaffold408_cov347-Pavlova_lutheri.AAC.58